MRKISALVFALFAGSFAHAEFSSGLGIFAHNLNGTTTSEDSAKTLIGPVYFPVQVRYTTQPYFGRLHWSPYLEFTHLTTMLVKNETPDGTAKRNFAIIGTPFEYAVADKFFISGGPGFMYYELKGKGGTKVVNNGTGTSTFGVPSKTRTSKIFLFEIGGGWKINEYRIGLDLYVSGFASERLATSFQATLSKSIGGQSW